MSSARRPNLLEALLPVIALMGFLVAAVAWLGIGVQVPLLLGAAAAAGLARWLGWRWNEIEQGIVEGIMLSIKPVVILLVIGVLIGTWMSAGIVPYLLHLGLQILSPAWFLPAACLLCCVISLATGSSWTTAGTVGIALMGVGQGLGFHPGMVAGAVISGAYFGDKLSPISETTNLAPGVTGVDLFDHVRHMTWTTLPSLGLAVVGFAVLGLAAGRDGGAPEVFAELTAGLASAYRFSPLLLAGPALVIAMVALRLPAIPALFAACVLGAVVAVGYQGRGLAEVLTAAQSGFASESGSEALDELLSRGGLESMMSTVLIILGAMSFGGIMERSGCLARIAAAILSLARGTGSLIVATLATCVGMNVIASDQYLAIVVPGRMYRDAFDRAGLHPKNLSRCLEDAGTLTSPLVPWNSCGAYMAATLGVPTWVYLPFCFFNLLNPLVSAFYGFTGWTMAKADTAPSREGGPASTGGQVLP